MFEKVYWPFEIKISADQFTAETRSTLAFLESAYRAGHKSYHIDHSLLGAEGKTGRCGEIIHRGRGRYWQLDILKDGKLEKSVYVDGLDFAAQAVLSWLGGDDCSAVLQAIESAIVSKPGERG